MNPFKPQEVETLIQNAMHFDLSAVVKRFASDNDIDMIEATTYETELKRYLILCILYPEKQYNMYSEKVDELWHTFIWHTPDYFHFCKTIAGRYIHHLPTPSETAGSATLSISTDANDLMNDPFYYDYVGVFKEEPSVVVWDALNATDISSFKCSRSPGRSCHATIEIDKEWPVLTE